MLTVIHWTLLFTTLIMWDASKYKVKLKVDNWIQNVLNLPPQHYALWLIIEFHCLLHPRYQKCRKIQKGFDICWSIEDIHRFSRGWTKGWEFKTSLRFCLILTCSVTLGFTSQSFLVADVFSCKGPRARLTKLFKCLTCKKVVSFLFNQYEVSFLCKN